MIYILKSKSGYRVRYTGKNGEVLAVSEVLTSKQNAWKNIAAVCKLYTQTSVFTVIDGDTEYRCLVKLNKLTKYIS